MKIKAIIKSLLIIFGPLALGFISSILINSNSYKVINKPILSPPSIVFPIMWSILYLLMGISLYVCIKEKFSKKTIILFLLQLTVNLIWPFLFFRFKLYYLSSAWILLLIYLVILLIENIYSIKKIAAYLQIPYFLWLIFALYLNIGVALLN